MTRIRVKKNLLIRCLYQTETELEYYQTQRQWNENLSYARVCREENMLREVLQHTMKDGDELESYESSIAKPMSNRPNDEHKFFADWTP